MTAHLRSPRRWRRLLATATAALTLTAGSLAATAVPAQAFVPKTPPLTTPWTNQVSPTNALPEYPAPAADPAGLAEPQRRLAVRRRVEHRHSAGRTPTSARRCWCRTRSSQRCLGHPAPARTACGTGAPSPSRRAGRAARVQLNFGAVDWQTKVWVNGTQVGTHEGGYDKFSSTSPTRSGPARNEIIVGVWDPTNGQDIPIGKQRTQPGGIFYTAVLRHLADGVAGARRGRLGSPGSTRRRTSPPAAWTWSSRRPARVHGDRSGRSAAPPSSAPRPAAPARRCECRCRAPGSGRRTTRTSTTCGSRWPAVTRSAATSACARSARRCSAASCGRR